MKVNICRTSSQITLLVYSFNCRTCYTWLEFVTCALADPAFTLVPTLQARLLSRSQQHGLWPDFRTTFSLDAIHTGHKGTDELLISIIVRPKAVAMATPLLIRQHGLVKPHPISTTISLALALPHYDLFRLHMYKTLYQEKVLWNISTLRKR